MNLETDDLLHYGVMWSVQGADSFGVPRVSAPVEFRCRWQLGKGVANSSSSNVHNLVGKAAVDQVIPLEVIVWKGRLEDLPSTPENLMEVVGYKESEDIKCENVRRTIMLSAWNGRLPAGV
jgi:hypothetical protein